MLMQLKFMQPHLVTKYHPYLTKIKKKLNNNNKKKVHVHRSRGKCNIKKGKKEEEEKSFISLRLKHILIKKHNFAMLMLTKRSVSS